MRTLRTLAAEGRRGLITLGVTPVVTAQLDDPYCLDAMDRWLANWQLRALEAANVHTATGATRHRQLRKPCGRSGIREHAEAERRSEDFGTLWRHGASPLLRRLIDAGTVELLGGPLAHPFQPLLNRGCVGSLFARAWPTPGQRFAHTPSGIWAPGMRLRAGHGARLRRRGRGALHGRRPPAR